MAPDELAVAQVLLSPDEVDRANRFHFPLHRDRFLIAHSWLRNVLSLYLDKAPSAISYHFTPEKKPYLEPANGKQLTFNLSHSADLAVCAVTIDHDIGIDIEQMETESKEDLAKRFFSKSEYNLLTQVPAANRLAAFYQIWARKEAILKATGKGLSIPLNQFSVSIEPALTHIELENKVWSLLPLSIHQDYQAALAMNGKVKKISYFEFINHKPTLMNEQVLS